MQPGGIELMINRKTTNSDHGGLEENLDIKGEVTVSFLLHLTPRTPLKDLFARLLPIQNLLQNPVQLFTTNNLYSKGSVKKDKRKALLSHLKSAKIVDINLFTVEKGKIKVRVTLAFDGVTVDKRQLARALCNYVEKKGCQIVQTTVSGEQTLDKARLYGWS